MSQTRRLAAILAADVAGYSRLMGADEEGTHERLKAHLAELVEPKIGEHRGRTVKNTGDGFLAEFASIVDAVRCAAELQRGMADRNAATPTDKRIEFRIGIHQGDIVILSRLAPAARRSIPSARMKRSIFCSPTLSCRVV
jgi:adenylate cyclase